MQSSVVWASCTTGLKYKNDCDGPWYTDTFHFHCTDRSLYLHLRYFSVIYMLYNNIINPLGVRFFWKKCWILTSRFQKLVAWKGLKIEIYCELENFWAWPKVYVWCKYTHRICILWRHHGGGPLEFHNIQEIVDIEWIFELIYMFVCFFVFLSSLQIIRKEETNNKTGESTKLLLYYYTI